MTDTESIAVRKGGRGDRVGRRGGIGGRAEEREEKGLDLEAGRMGTSFELGFGPAVGDIY